MIATILLYFPVFYTLSKCHNSVICRLRANVIKIIHIEIVLMPLSNFWSEIFVNIKFKVAILNKSC